MRYLGIDWGSRNVGLAMSDPSAGLALPYKTIRYRKIADLIDELRAIIVREQIVKIILGLPKNFKQEDSAQTKEVRQAGKVLENNLGLPVVFQDELFTSKLAEKHSVKDTHASAAAIILQSYLDSLHKEDKY